MNILVPKGHQKDPTKNASEQVGSQIFRVNLWLNHIEAIILQIPGKFQLNKHYSKGKP